MMSPHVKWFRVVFIYCVLFSTQLGICAELLARNTSDCYIVNEGRAIYTGSKNVTKSGHKCLPWSWVLHDTTNIQEKLVASSCRDPISLGKPFCGTMFVEHAETHFGYFSKIEICDIPKCTSDY